MFPGYELESSDLSDFRVLSDSVTYDVVNDTYRLHDTYLRRHLVTYAVISFLRSLAR